MKPNSSSSSSSIQTSNLTNPSSTLLTTSPPPLSPPPPPHSLNPLNTSPSTPTLLITRSNTNHPPPSPSGKGSLSFSSFDSNYTSPSPTTTTTTSTLTPLPAFTSSLTLSPTTITPIPIPIPTPTPTDHSEINLLHSFANQPPPPPPPSVPLPLQSPTSQTLTITQPSSLTSTSLTPLPPDTTTIPPPPPTTSPSLLPSDPTLLNPASLTQQPPPPPPSSSSLLLNLPLPSFFFEDKVARLPHPPPFSSTYHPTSTLANNDHPTLPHHASSSSSSSSSPPSLSEMKKKKSVPSKSAPASPTTTVLRSSMKKTTTSKEGGVDASTMKKEEPAPSHETPPALGLPYYEKSLPPLPLSAFESMVSSGPPLHTTQPTTSTTSTPFTPPLPLTSTSSSTSSSSSTQPRKLSFVPSFTSWTSRSFENPLDEEVLVDEPNPPFPSNNPASNPTFPLSLNNAAAPLSEVIQQEDFKHDPSDLEHGSRAVSKLDSTPKRTSSLVSTPSSFSKDDDDHNDNDNDNVPPTTIPTPLTPPSFASTSHKTTQTPPPTFSHSSWTSSSSSMPPLFNPDADDPGVVGPGGVPPTPTQSSTSTSTGSSGGGSGSGSSSKNTMFHSIFKSIPKDEKLIEDFSCALQKEILVQGRLYLTHHHLCFNAVLFGWTSSLLIAFSDVTAIEKKSTALIFPNAIEITTVDRKYFFASFLFREQAFNLIYQLWCRINPNAPVIPLVSAPSTLGPRGHHHHHPQRTLERFNQNKNGHEDIRNTTTSTSSTAATVRLPRQVSLDQLSSSTNSRNASGKKDAFRGGGGSDSGAGGVEEETIFDVSASDTSLLDFEEENQDDDDELDDEEEEDEVEDMNSDRNILKKKKSKNRISSLSKSFSISNAFASLPRTSSSSSLLTTDTHGTPSTTLDTKQNLKHTPTSYFYPLETSNHQQGEGEEEKEEEKENVSYPVVCNSPSYDTLVYETLLTSLTVPQLYTHLYTPETTKQNEMKGGGHPPPEVPKPFSQDPKEKYPTTMYQYCVDQLGCTEMTMPPFSTPSSSSVSSSKSRQVKYILPIKSTFPMAPKQTWVISDETLDVLTSKHLCVHSITQTPDVPTGLTFTVHSRLCCLHRQVDQVQVKVFAKVVWSKPNWMLKSVVEAGTLDGQKKHWTGFFDYLTNVIIHPTLMTSSSSSFDPQPTLSKPTSSSLNRNLKPQASSSSMPFPSTKNTSSSTLLTSSSNTTKKRRVKKAHLQNQPEDENHDPLEEEEEEEEDEEDPKTNLTSTHPPRPMKKNSEKIPEKDPYASQKKFFWIILLMIHLVVFLQLIYLHLQLNELEKNIPLQNDRKK